MAEELDIRSLWNSSKKREDPRSLQIDTLERKGTKTTLYWVKFILWIEFWLTLIGGPFAVWWMHSLYHSTIFSVSYGLFCLAYLFYYQFLIRAIQNFNYDGNVIESLKKVYGYLRFYLLHYKVVIWLVVPFAFVGGIIVGINQDNGIQEDADLSFWLRLIGITLLFIAVIGGVLHFIIHLIYGRKIKRLKGMVKEFENE